MAYNVMNYKKRMNNSDKMSTQKGGNKTYKKFTKQMEGNTKKYVKMPKNYKKKS